jgi:hypothetical protein
MRREILKSVENGHDAPSNNAHACIGIMMGCIEESGLLSESKSGVDVGVGDGVRVARNARDASHTAPFTGLPDRSFTFRSLYRYRLLTKKKTFPAQDRQKDDSAEARTQDRLCVRQK